MGNLTSIKWKLKNKWINIKECIHPYKEMAGAITVGIAILAIDVAFFLFFLLAIAKQEIFGYKKQK